MVFFLQVHEELIPSLLLLTPRTPAEGNGFSDVAAKEIHQLDLWALDLTLDVTACKCFPLDPTNHSLLSMDKQGSEDTGSQVDSSDEGVQRVAAF